jgi:hypothetical protein
LFPNAQTLAQTCTVFCEIQGENAGFSIKSAKFANQRGAAAR